MSQLRSFGIFVVVACSLTPGCSDASRDSDAVGVGSGGGGADAKHGDDDDGGAGGDGNGDDQDGAGASDPSGPTPACVRYLDCVAAADPALLSEAEASVGEEGPCWDGDAARRASCDEGCRSGLADERASAPDETRCDECTTDADCGEGTPHCREDFDGSDDFRVCAECATDADCAEGGCDRGVCDVDACLDRWVGLWSAISGSPACYEDCGEVLGAACTGSEICCMHAAQVDCAADPGCVLDTCGASSSCQQGLEATNSCVQECM